MACFADVNVPQGSLATYARCGVIFSIHTHTRLINGPFSRTTQVSNEWQQHQLGHMQVCMSIQTDNHTSTLAFSFYTPDALPAVQPTALEH